MRPRIAIPIPTSFDPEYNDRSWPQYAQAIERAGGEPVPIPLNDPPAATANLIASCTGVLLPGSGADVNPHKYGQDLDPASAPPDPARENVDELLLQDAHNMGKPLLAICFGAQMLNVWRGGSLIQDLPSALPASAVNHKAGRTVLEAHPVEITPHSVLGELSDLCKSNKINDLYNITANSSHHQAIAAPGDGLAVTARSSSDGVIEAIENAPGASEWSRSFLLGIQWHPERTYDHSPLSRAIFERFTFEAAAWKPRTVTTSVG